MSDAVFYMSLNGRRWRCDVRGVLAAAYPRGRRPKSTLYHVAMTPAIAAEGEEPTRTLCGNVMPANLADAAATPFGQVATCPVCAARLTRAASKAEG